jgi:F0F1-type ATP synthase delta subunit
MAKMDVSGIKERFAKAREQAIGSGAIDQKTLHEQKENDRKIGEIRGLLLNRTAELEHQVNLFLAYYFTRDEKRAMEFYDQVLSKEFFTLHQKIALLGELGYHKQERFKGRFDGLTGRLHRVKDIRNLIAHGHKASASEPKVRMLTMKEPVALDDKFLSDFKEAFESSFFSLVELNADIRGQLLPKAAG